MKTTTLLTKTQATAKHELKNEKQKNGKRRFLVQFVKTL